MFSANRASAQIAVDLAPTQFSVNIIPLMAQFEARVGEKQSVTLGGGLGYSLYYSNVNGNGDFEAYTTPFVSASLRNYYNRKSVKKNNLKRNSGNYVALLVDYQFDTYVDLGILGSGETDLNSYSIGPVWGFQRNYGSGLHFDLSIGLGYTGGQSDEFVEIENSVTFIGGLELGYRF
ncbi:MAG: hypothetical protein AAGC88_02070 [Bacteroidota bacterium]